LKRIGSPLAGSLLAIVLAGSPLLAGENLETERLIANVMQQGAMADQGALSRSQGWAVLPQFGYSPEKGPNAGIKFTDRDATRRAWSSISMAATPSRSSKTSRSPSSPRIS
jgi:hypothetical protein